ncbi:hypothetical protein [Gloeothece verrucosa]|uniref:Uncharacterized protein n=1 Tax=Gloeothece verrucosa (strain PCC 7822) TaxID=497965 RepID=E0UEN0_GLOV7|nr:hypothetical protein [Gloeothece verrucosa]ADN16598.1 hypothetical protein Cyan7822_4693 [Gloeothece verrucosa PCC 7822]
MKIITSDSQKTSVLLPTQLTQLYTRLDGGAIVNRQFDSDLSEAFRSGEFDAHIVAQKADLVLINPSRPNYSPVRPLTLGDFYKGELFREIFAIPVSGWILKDKQFVEKTRREPNRLEENVLCTFLLRGRSLDEYAKMVTPFEVSLFQEYIAKVSELKPDYPTIESYVAAKANTIYSEKIFSFVFTHTNKGVKAHWYLTWSYRDPINETEKELLEIGNKISSDPEICSHYLVNPVAEKGYLKAISGESAAPSVPGLRPGLATNSLPATATK